MANIDRNDAPLISTVPQSRNWEHTQGDRRTPFGIRFRVRGTPDNAPEYLPIHASQWGGHILQRRSEGGNPPLSVDLTFNNVPFQYDFTDDSGTTAMFSNREIQFHIPWENTTLQSMLNPIPNRGVAFLYDIWQVTYPNATDSFITNSIETISEPGHANPPTFSAGDLVHWERLDANRQIVSRIDKLDNDNLSELRFSVPDSSSYVSGTWVACDYTFLGGSTNNYVLGQVERADATSSPNTFDIRVRSIAAGGEEQNNPLPEGDFGGVLNAGTPVFQLNLSTRTDLSRVRFRGTGLIRERIFNNPSAGNEDSNTGN